MDTAQIEILPEKDEKNKRAAVRQVLRNNGP
jgi:hypothetical protein